MEARICFGIAVAMLVPFLGYIGFYITRKVRERCNKSNQHSSVQMKMLKPVGGIAHTDETTYVEDN